jgi:hypothetical protein
VGVECKGHGGLHFRSLAVVPLLDHFTVHQWLEPAGESHLKWCRGPLRTSSLLLLDAFRIHESEEKEGGTQTREYWSPLARARFADQ